jgi:hypothetical protein
MIFASFYLSYEGDILIFTFPTKGILILFNQNISTKVAIRALLSPHSKRI